MELKDATSISHSAEQVSYTSHITI